MTDETAVVPAQPTETISFGQAHLTADQLIPPRVKIVQMMSAERASKQAEAGNFWNTLTSEDLGNEIKFLPLSTFMNRVLLVRDQRRDQADIQLKAAKLPKLTEGDGLKCRSIDMEHGNGEPGIVCDACPLSKWWGPGNTEAPLCSEVYNVAALTELGDLVILQFQRSSAKVGRKFFSMLRFAGPGVAPWSRFYVARTHEEQGPKGPFFAPVVNRVADEVPPTELMRQAYAWAAVLGNTAIDVTPAEDEEAEVAGAPGAEPKDGDPF